MQGKNNLKCQSDQIDNQKGDNIGKQDRNK